MGKVLSIDIGTDNIKIVEADKQLKSIKVYKAFKVTTPEFTVDDGVLRNKELIASVIQDALVANKIKTKDVIFTITSSKIVTREVIIPFVAPNRVNDIINLNSSEYFPFNVSDYILDHKIIEIIKEGSRKELKIFIAAAPVSFMADYSELANLLHLRLDALDFSGNSIYQLSKRQQINGNYMTIGLGPQSTLITIMEENRLGIQRATTYGTEELYKAVMNRYGIGREEAINMLYSKSLLFKMESGPEDYADEVLGTINSLITGISRIMDYYRSRNQEKPFEKIYLYGTGTQVIDIDKFIEKRFGITTVITDKFESIVFHKNFTSQDNPIIYITAIGAIFEPFNLKPELDGKGLSKSDKTFYSILGGIVALVFIASILVPNIKQSSLNKKKETLENGINKIQEIDQVVTEKDNLMGQVKFREQLVTLTDTYTDDILDVLKSMEENMPINTVFVSMNINVDGIVLNTRADDIGTIAKLIQQMKKVPYFSDVTTTGFSKSEDVEVYDMAVNANGETIKTPIGTVDLYDVTLNCYFVSPYVNLNEMEGE